MHKLYVLLAGVCIATGTMAQSDTTQPQKSPDTIRIGNLIIVRSGNKNDSSYKHSTGVYGDVFTHRRRKKRDNVSTNWGIIDLGFANFTDKTNYAGAAAQAIVPGGKEELFGLRYGKSVDVNIWVFMQRRNLAKHVLNLKYGIGLELNNYRYDEPVLYDKNTNTFGRDTRHYRKNKLAADYLTVPLMLNINCTPEKDYDKSFGFSAGISAGYLYSSRQKTITSEDGKQKIRDDFGLEPFKISYVGEIQLGPVKLYGSMATKSMFKKGLDQTPYTFGFRLSNW